MSTAHVLITCRQMQNCFAEFQSEFEQRGITWEMPEVVQQPTEDELIDIIGRFDGMIAGDDPLTARVLEHAGRMKVISKWGVGIDGIDVAAAEARGIKVTRTPAVFGDDVADVAIGYMVMLARQLHRIHDSVRDGGWFKWEGLGLTGKTLGVVGYGSIGQAVGRRGKGFGMEVVAFDVEAEALSEAASLADVSLVPLEDVFRRADFLVLCCPLTPDNHHLVNATSLAWMPLGSHLINVARGPLVDERGLEDALASRHLAAAALDVFEEEPLPDDSPLRHHEQCVFGSHNGSNTREGVLRASARAVANLFDGLHAR